jgi:hypothetical protein
MTYCCPCPEHDQERKNAETIAIVLPKATHPVLLEWRSAYLTGFAKAAIDLDCGLVPSPVLMVGAAITPLIQGYRAGIRAAKGE